MGFFCKLFIGNHHWGVDTLSHIDHMTPFNYDVKKARDVGLSCRCYMSDRQIVCSVWNMLERITCLWLCISLYICCYHCCCCFCVFLFCFPVFWGFYLFICLCAYLSFVFFRDISLHTYVIEAVRFLGLSLIIVNL